MSGNYEAVFAGGEANGLLFDNIDLINCLCYNKYIMGRHASNSNRSGSRLKQVLGFSAGFGLAGISANLAGKAMEYDTLREAGEYFAVGAPLAVVASSIVTRVGEKVGVPRKAARVVGVLATAGWVSYEAVQMHVHGEMSGAEMTGALAGANLGTIAGIAAVSTEAAPSQPPMPPQTPEVPPTHDYDSLY